MHSFLNLPLKLSTKALCCGLPGARKLSSTLLSWDHLNITELRNSGPLSQTMNSGKLRYLAISVSSLAILMPDIEVSTTWWISSRVKSSIMLSTRNLLPYRKLSETKSIDHRWLGYSAWTRGLVLYLICLCGRWGTWSLASQYKRLIRLWLTAPYLSLIAF